METRNEKTLSFGTRMIRFFFNPEDELLKPISYDRLVYLITEEQCNPLYNDKGFNALHVAALPDTCDKIKRFEFLLDQGLNINSVNGLDLYHNTVLHTLIVNEDEQTAIDLIKLCTKKEIKPDFNLIDINEVTVFSLAVKCRLVNLALFLLTHCEDFKIEINYADKDGNTPLHYAYALGLPGLVVKLLEAEADSDALNKNKQTPKEMLNCDRNEVSRILLSANIYPQRDKKATRNYFLDLQGHASFVIMDKKGIIKKIRIPHKKSRLTNLKLCLNFYALLDQNEYAQGKRVKLTGEEKSEIWKNAASLTGTSLLDNILSIKETVANNVEKYCNSKAFLL